MQTDLDILVLSETWLKNSISDSDVALMGYNLYRVDRTGRGGGVSIYVKTGFSVTILKAVTIPRNFEFLALKVQLGPNSVIVVGVYRPPSAELGSIDAIADLLSHNSDAELIVMGDFNLNWLNDTSSHFKEVSAGLNLFQLITEPTRPNLKDSSKSTLIDLIFSNRVDNITAWGVFELGISDHCPVGCIRSTRLMKTKSHKVIRRNLRHFNEQAFLSDVSHSNIQYTSEITDVDLALDFFTKTLLSVIDRHAPLKKT